MDKTKTKSKGLIKATAVGFAFMLCGAFFPAHAIANAADSITDPSKIAEISRIEVGEDGKQSQSVSVKKGEQVTIPQGVYYYKGGQHNIGVDSDTASITSTREVFYKATNEKVTDTAGGVFTADKIGRYTVVYTVNHDGVNYSYELDINCEASEATFEFEANTANIIPSVYDVTLADGKDINLPLPTVKDSDGEVIFSADEVENYVLNQEKPDGATSYVNIRISTNDKGVEIQPVYDDPTSDAKKVVGYKIPGDKLSEAAGQEFKVYYTYYQTGTENNVGVYVSSVSKTFKVSKNHYYTTSDKNTAGYELTTSWSTSVSALSAVVGIEKELPKLTATTKSTNSPASEKVEISYTIDVYRDGKLLEDEEKAEVLDGHTFKANKEGDYKFVYSVSDFYGKTVKESNTTFTINNVEDTVSAKVYMYDALTHVDGEDYVSAENILKSQTVNRNIIMYAVGGTDNMPSNTIKLRREVRSTAKMFVIDEDLYDNYNLIFAPAAVDYNAESGESYVEAVYRQVATDNYQIRKQMVEAGKDFTKGAEVKAFLEGKYLLVTTEANKFNGELIEGMTEDGKYTAQDYIDAGFAYVAPENKNNVKFNAGSYSFYYYARDVINGKEINKETSTYYTVKVSENLTDAEVPTLTFSSELQVAYLPTDKFEFKAASANDTTDTRIKAVTAYRFIDSTGAPIEIAGETTSLKYVVGNSNSTEWYAKAPEGKNGLIDASIAENKGWIVDEDATKYTVDLSNSKYKGAKAVEILAYAIDDHGNAGFYHNTIQIADAEDTDMPTLYKIANAPKSTSYDAKQTIDLPTLYFEDENANYMHANVAVYKLNTDGTKTRVQNTNVSTEFYSDLGAYKVIGGTFHASTAGKYQVAFTVKDAGNHAVTTYFTYQFVGGVDVVTPEITNITSETISLDAGQSYYLAPPRINMSETDEYGFVGIDNDDSNIATNYTTTVTYAEGDYELDQYYFKGNEKGVYKLQYKVYLIQYSKDAEVFATSASTAEVGDIYFDENGRLRFKYDTTGEDYYVYIDRENGNALAANKSKLGIGDAISEDGLKALDDIVNVYAKESNVQTFNVGGVEMKITLEDIVYQDKYLKGSDPVTIQKPSSIEYNGASYSTHAEESKVRIEKNGNLVGEFSFAEWGEAVDTNSNFIVSEDKQEVKLKFGENDNGKYTITYTIYAQDKLGNKIEVSKEPYTYNFSYGDVSDPTIRLDKVVKAKYKVGNKMTLDLAGVTLADEGGDTTYDDLLASMKVTIENTDLGDGKVTLDGGENHSYSHTFESAGNYTLRITVTDNAGRSTTETKYIEVVTDEKEETDVKEVMGGVLIGLSVAVLAGVVIYFVISKVKLDKKEKSYRKGNDKK